MQASRVSLLISDLLSEVGPVINTAISGFSTLETQTERDEAFELLLGLLKHPNPWYRLRAARALGALGDRRAIDPLVETLPDDDPDAGTEMIEARFEVLSAFKDPRAIKPLIEQIYRVDFKQAWDLYAFGNDAVAPMIEALKNSNQETRRHAAYWLGNKHNPAAIKPLIEMISDPLTSHQVRIEGVFALGLIGSGDAVPFLQHLLGTEDHDIREHAAKALQRIQDTDH